MVLSKILEAQNLEKSFGGLKVLRKISFYVKKGESLGLIGPNGAGKTTIIDLIMGKFKQDSGNILFKGEEISNLKTYERVNIGLARTFQVPKVLSSSPIVKNIELFRMSNTIGLIRQRGQQWKAAVEIANNLGLWSSLSKLPSELNIADIRKLELAMSVAVKPELLLMDELFAGMSWKESSELCEHIRRMKEKGELNSVILVDHNLRPLKAIVDRVVVIHLGEKLAEGTFKEISMNKKVRIAYLGAELK